VGFPRESRISRARTFSILVIVFSPPDLAAISPSSGLA
jgi:hypothetical protein